MHADDLGADRTIATSIGHNEFKHMQNLALHLLDHHCSISRYSLACSGLLLFKALLNQAKPNKLNCREASKIQQAFYLIRPIIETINSLNILMKSNKDFQRIESTVLSITWYFGKSIHVSRQVFQKVYLRIIEALY